MTDFIDGLERDLVDAAQRQQRARRAAAEIRRRRLDPLRSRRGLAACFAALLVAGSATAAVISHDPEPSKPLRGAVPPASPATESAREYAISMSPDLSAGAVGWCTTITFSDAARPVATGMACGPARSASGLVMAGGRLVVGRELLLDFVVTPGDVPVVRMPNGRRIITRRDGSLPADWRAAVTLARGNLNKARGSFKPPVPEDASGRPLVDSRSPSSFTGRAATRRVSPGDRSAPCGLGPAPNGFRAQTARIAIGRPRVPAQVAGPLYLSCAQTRFAGSGHHGALMAAVLVPANRTPALPRPQGTAMSSRRIRHGWLVVQGTPTAQRLRLLNALSPHARP